MASMEEPLALREVPQDEDARRALPVGTFSGIEVGDARDSLESLVGDPEGLLVVRVIENSPADAAGVSAGDLLLSARVDDGASVLLSWPADWRSVELESKAGAEVELVLDRASVEFDARFKLEARVHPATAPEVARYREEDKVGVVLRTATEVEARAAGLAPGGGAVVVGLAKESPWRTAGLRFGDVLVRVDGTQVQHAGVVLQAIRGADEPLRLTVMRGSTSFEIDARVSRRAQEVTDISIPLLFSYESNRGVKSLSMAIGLFSWVRTPVAWEVELLWLFSLAGGDAGRLREVDA